MPSLKTCLLRLIIKDSSVFTRALLMLLMLVLGRSNSLEAQQINLVSNPSLETFTTCPNTLSQLGFATGWGQPTLHYGSPDYFNACQTNTVAGVPTNTFGSLAAAQGNAYCGFYIYLPNNTYREYVVATLTSALVAGQSYVVAFQYARAPGCRYASDALGFYLSSAYPAATSSTAAALPYTPTSYNQTGNYLTSTSWQWYIDTIVAGGGEQYITIGSFTQNANGQQVASSGIGGAYMYVDNASIYVYNGIFGDSNICLGETAQVYTILDTTQYWVSANDPNTVISTADTIYVAPTVTTTYLAIAADDTFSFTVNVHDLPETFVGPDTNICEGDTLVRALNMAPYNYLWDDNETDSVLTTTDGGIHWLEISIYGCSERDSFEVFFHPFPEFALPNDTTICHYDHLPVSTGLTSPLLFSWNTGALSPAINVIDSGTYMVTVTNNYCSYSDTIHVAYHPEISVELGHDSDFCYQSVVPLTATATNATQFTWSTGGLQPSISVTQSGTYTVTASNGFCIAKDSVIYNLYFEPNVDLGPDAQFCHDENFIIETGLTTPLQFKWMDNTTTSSYTTNAPGLYWVEVSDEHCATRDSIELSFYPIIDVTLGEDLQGCIGKEVVITPQISGPVTSFIWSDGSTGSELRTSTHGTYSVTASDEHCTVSDAVNVFLFEKPIVDLGPDTWICEGESKSFDVTQKALIASYQWMNGNVQPVQEFETKDTLVVSVEVTNVGCRERDTIMLYVHRPKPVNLGLDTLICADDKVEMNVVNRSDLEWVQWNTGDTNRAFTATIEDSVVTLRYFDGKCIGSSKRRIAPQPTPPTSLLKDAPEEICLGETYVANVADPTFTGYRWQDGSTSARMVVESDGLYWVEAYHPCGVVRDSVLIDKCECAMWLPNSFRPDGDGINDGFFPTFDCSPVNYTFTVFNRWNEIVFESAVPGEAWDGTYMNEPAPGGTYAWIISYRADANRYEKSGKVILLR